MDDNLIRSMAGQIENSPVKYGDDYGDDDDDSQ